MQRTACRMWFEMLRDWKTSSEDTKRQVLAEIRRAGELFKIKARPIQGKEDAMEVCVVAATENEALRLDAFLAAGELASCSDAQFERLARLLENSERPLAAFFSLLGKLVEGKLHRVWRLIQASFRSQDAVCAALQAALEQVRGNDIASHFLALELAQNGVLATADTARPLPTMMVVLQEICLNLGFLDCKHGPETSWADVWESIAPSDPIHLDIQGVLTLLEKPLSWQAAELVLGMLNLLCLGESLSIETAHLAASVTKRIFVQETNVHWRARWAWPLLCMLEKLQRVISVQQSLAMVPACETIPLHVQDWSRVAQLLALKTKEEIDAYTMHVACHETWFTGSTEDARAVCDAAFQRKFYLLSAVIELEFPGKLLLSRASAQTFAETFATDVGKPKEEEEVLACLALLTVILLKDNELVSELQISVDLLSARSGLIRAALLYLVAALGENPPICVEELLFWALNAETQIEREAAIYCGASLPNTPPFFPYLAMCNVLDGNCKVKQMDQRWERSGNDGWEEFASRVQFTSSESDTSPLLQGCRWSDVQPRYVIKLPERILLLQAPPRCLNNVRI